MRTVSALSVSILAAALIAATADAEEISVRLSSGLDFSTGDYGAETDTDILTIPWRAALQFDDFELSVATSYLDVKGAGNVVPGGAGPIVTQRCARVAQTRPDLFNRLCRDRLDPDPVDERFSNSGLGDTVVGALWSLPATVTGDWLVDLGVRVKLPTASESKSLGTGKTDASFSLDLARGFGPWTVYAGAGYRILGDPTIGDGTGQTETINLLNGATATAGLIYSFDAGASVSLGYDYLARSIKGAAATQEATLGISMPVGDSGWRWSGYGVAGLSRSSADFAAGFALSYSFSGL